MTMISSNSSLPISPLSAETTLSSLKMKKEASIEDTLNLESMGNLENLKNYDDIKAAAEDFEAVFVAQMIKPMFEGLETDSMFGGGQGEEVFRGLMIEEYGKAVAARDITGIQSHVMDKLIEIQAAQSAE